MYRADTPNGGELVKTFMGDPLSLSRTAERQEPPLPFPPLPSTQNTTDRLQRNGPGLSLHRQDRHLAQICSWTVVGDLALMGSRVVDTAFKSISLYCAQE